MNYQQLLEHGYNYVLLKPKEGNVVGRLFKIAVVTDKLLEGYKFSSTDGENKDNAVFDQIEDKK